jgi:hypothetical protein
MGKDSKSTTTDNCCSDPKKVSRTVKMRTVSVVIVVLTHSKTSHKPKKTKKQNIKN